jgi:hypothetical protein
LRFQKGRLTGLRNITKKEDFYSGLTDLEGHRWDRFPALQVGLSHCRLTAVLQSLARWNEGGPGFAGFWLVFLRFTGDGGDANQVIATGALDLPAGIRRVAGQMLFAVRTFKFQFIHGYSFY